MSRSQAREVAPEPAAPPPRANPDLLGHEAAEAELRRLFDSGRMPHALLLSGPRGIGKATLAFRLARFVLAQLLARLACAAARDDADNAVLRRLAGRAPARRWAELREEIGQSFLRTDALNLDKKQTILGAFFAIAGAAR